MKYLAPPRTVPAFLGFGALMLAPAAAEGAINVSADPERGTVTVTADAGTSDELYVTDHSCRGSCFPSSISVASETTPLVAGANCIKLTYPDGSTQVQCGIAAELVSVDSGDGNDEVTVGGTSAFRPTYSVVLGDGDDVGHEYKTTDSTIDGGAGDDVIDGLHTVLGGDGDDVITGFELSGGDGDDTLGAPKKFSRSDIKKFGAFHGGAGNDIVRGSEKAPVNDLLFGDAGKDKLYEGAGRDKLNGGSGKDFCDGGPVGDKKKRKADIAVSCEKAVDVYVKPGKK